MTQRRSIVYLLLCYGFPNELQELFRTLYHPADHYIFHCDAKAPPALRGLIDAIAAGFPNVHRIEDRLCAWGGYSLVDATLRGIDHALDAIPHWSHFVPLSEQHRRTLIVPYPRRIAATAIAEVRRQKRVQSEIGQRPLEWHKTDAL